MYKRINDSVSSGACPFCGNVSFRYTTTKTEMFLCHSCQRNFPWDRAVVQTKNKDSEKETQYVQINYRSILQFCQTLQEIPRTHFANGYVRNRKIPTSQTQRLYYTEKTEKIGEVAGFDLSAKKGLPKLVIPFFNEKDELFGMQLRSLDNDKPRYMTFMFDESEEKIYGKEKVDMNSPFVCVEGPIDSLFLKNSVAMAGSDGLPNKYITNATMAFDNEPRNEQIVKKIKKHLEIGYKVVVWPDIVKEKDINDMVIAGHDVESIIEHNTFSGMTGLIRLNNWKKV